MTVISRTDPILAPTDDAPWWARQSGVAIIVALWCLIHAWVASYLEAAINVDDAIESYLVQSFEWSYVPRNPPLFDWILYGLQKVVGTGPISFAILRYVLLFACAMLVYRVARRVIASPRLQALSVFSLSTLWVIGYHSHRILTHSNVMIVAIAGTFLTLMAIVRKPSLGLYAGLGAWIAVGVLGKFGFVAFFGVLLLASLMEPSFRRALLDRRIALTLVVAAIPLALYALALRMLQQDVVASTAEVVGPSTSASWELVLNTFIGAWAGYLLPFLALVALIFLPGNRGQDAVADTPDRAAPRRVLRTLIFIGTVGTLCAVIAVGSSNLRDRYFHVFFLLAPVYVFAELERLGGWRPRVPYYLGALALVAVGVIGVRVAVPLWPDPRLCGRCVAAEPLWKLGPLVTLRLGEAPTLIADDRMSAGRLRAAIPDARVVIFYENQYRPPARQATGCARISGIANGFGRSLLPPADPGTTELPMKWTSPLMNPHRYSTWQIQPLPLDDPQCR